MPCKYLEIEADVVRDFPESADDVAHVSTQTLFHEELLGSAQRLLSKKLLASVASVLICPDHATH